MDIESKALIFATNAHCSIDQRRKYTHEPYIVHPIAVSEIVRSVDSSSYMIASALLHDTVEDTSITLDDIYNEFGARIGSIVYWLTDISKPSDGNRSVRKQIDLDHISKAPAIAKTIKLADMIDNTKDISKHDPEFWVIYQQEKKNLLEVLKEGNQQLWQKAYEQVYMV